MLDVVSRADEMFTDLAGRSRGRSGKLSGTLVVTALSGVVPLVMPALRDFHLAHPQIGLEFAASSDLARLEHGEAHVAFRAGPKPDTPDYVVKPFRRVCFGLFASRDYIGRCGHPEPGALSGHEFVGSTRGASRLPYAQWMNANLGPESLSLKTEDRHVTIAAVKDGIGLGFLADHDASGDPDLVEILPPSLDWSVPIWVVTHVDLHRTEKVQRFLKHV